MIPLTMRVRLECWLVCLTLALGAKKVAALGLDGLWIQSRIYFWNHLLSDKDPHARGGVLLASEEESSLSPVFSLGYNFRGSALNLGVWGEYQRIGINSGTEPSSILFELWSKDPEPGVLMQNRYGFGFYLDYELAAQLHSGVLLKSSRVVSDWEGRGELHFTMWQINPWVTWHWNQAHATTLFGIFTHFEDDLDSYESFQSYWWQPLRLSVGIRQIWNEPWPKARLVAELKRQEVVANDIWLDHLRFGQSLSYEQQLYRVFSLHAAVSSYQRRYRQGIRRLAGCGDGESLFYDYPDPQLCVRSDLDVAYELGVMWKFLVSWELNVAYEAKESRNQKIREFEEFNRWVVISLAWHLGPRLTDRQLVGGPYERFQRDYW